jgi:hypothetical protein
MRYKSGDLHLGQFCHIACDEIGEIRPGKSHTHSYFFVLTRKRLTLLALQYLSINAV